MYLYRDGSKIWLASGLVHVKTGKSHYVCYNCGMPYLQSVTSAASHILTDSPLQYNSSFFKSK